MTTLITNFTDALMCQDSPPLARCEKFLGNVGFTLSRTHPYPTPDPKPDPNGGIPRTLEKRNSLAHSHFYQTIRGTKCLTGLLLETAPISAKYNAHVNSESTSHLRCPRIRGLTSLGLGLVLRCRWIPSRSRSWTHNRSYATGLDIKMRFNSIKVFPTT